MADLKAFLAANKLSHLTEKLVDEDFTKPVLQQMAKEEAAYAPIIAWTADTLQLKLNVTDSMVLTHPSEALPRAEALLEGKIEQDFLCVALHTVLRVGGRRRC